MNRSLHPNLARVAAAYDEVLLEFQQGRIVPSEARRRILALVARDDNGLEWSIDPDTGRWRYKSHFGGYTLGDPPGYGVLTATPHDLGSGDGLASDGRVHFENVDLVALQAQHSLIGSTLITPDLEDASAVKRRWPLVAALIGVLVVAALFVAVL